MSAATARECRKVMATLEKSQAGTKTVGIEMATDPQARRRLEGREHGPQRHSIVILLGKGPGTCIERIAHSLRPHHSNIGRQVVIAASYKGPHRAWIGEAQVQLLATGVHACIRATGTCYSNRFSDNLLKRLLDQLLDGDGVELPLPTPVSGTKVGDRQPVRRSRFRATTKGVHISRKGHGIKGIPRSSGI